MIMSDAGSIALKLACAGARGSAQSRTVAAQRGETLLVALKRAGLPLLAVCGGRAACGTCLVGIAPDWIARLPPQSRVERNLLGAIGAGEENERLACQITLTAALDGIEIHPLD